MNRLLFTLALLIGAQFGLAQSKTTQDLHKKYSDAFTLFFYSNTLKMYIPSENEEFLEMVKDLDKVKLLKVDKAKNKFSKEDYSKLVNSYRGENFEDLMSMKQNGTNIEVLIKEKNGKTLGLVVLMNENDSLTIVDILGSIPMNKIAEFAMKVEKKDFN
jgi:DNA repair exonuclease SbcCD ATPase subunit